MIAVAEEIIGFRSHITRIDDSGELERRCGDTRTSAGYDRGAMLISRATAARLSRLLDGAHFVHCGTAAQREAVLRELTTDIVAIFHEVVHSVACGWSENDADKAFREGIAELIAEREYYTFVTNAGLHTLEPGLMTSPFWEAYPCETAAVNVLVHANALRTGNDRRSEAMLLARDGTLRRVAARSRRVGPGRWLHRRVLTFGFKRVAAEAAGTPWEARSDIGRATALRMARGLVGPFRFRRFNQVVRGSALG